MKLYRIIAICFLAGFISSCCQCRKAGSKGIASFAGTEWKLIQWDSETLTNEPNNTYNNYVITFAENGNLSGVGDCNRFSGNYTFDDKKAADKIDIAQLASTRMACPDQSKENAFFETLKSVQRFNIDGDLLILSDPGRLVFEKVQK